MCKILASAIVTIVLGLSVHAQTTAPAAPDAGELTSLLNEFLAGASRNDAAVHDRFWAEDVIYTGSGGRRRIKAEIMHDVRSGQLPSLATRRPPTLPKTFAFNSTERPRSWPSAWSARLRETGGSKLQIS